MPSVSRSLRQVLLTACTLVAVLLIAVGGQLATPAAAQTMTAGVITSPTPGSTLTGATVTFTWSAGSGVSDYYLLVGTGFEGGDLFSQDMGTALTATVNGLPANGSTLYVTLESLGTKKLIQDYTYTASAPARPTVTALSPSGGSTAGGTAVTITGTNFSTASNATSVLFGTTAATGVSCSSSTSCISTSPAAAAGTVDVRVSVAGLQSGVVAADQFSYAAP